MKVILSTAVLAGALQASAKNIKEASHRPTLVGVCIDFINASDGVISGTDGGILFAHKFCADGSDKWPAEPLQIIVPRTVIEAVLKTKGKFVALEAAPREGSAMYVLGSVLFNPVEGRYPMNPRVIPSSVSGEAAMFNVALLQRAHKAVALACGVSEIQAILYQNGGTSSGVVQGDDENTICVVMPLNLEQVAPKGAKSYKAWVQPES